MATEDRDDVATRLAAMWEPATLRATPAIEASLTWLKDRARSHPKGGIGSTGSTSTGTI